MNTKIPTHFDAGKFFAVGYAIPKEDKAPQAMYAVPADIRALHSTLYSVAKIAAEMRWDSA
jgi:hypothetical protein